jgi:hypothetical protein
MGHSGIQITSDIYTSLFEEVDRQAAEAVAALVPRAARTDEKTVSAPDVRSSCPPADKMDTDAGSPKGAARDSVKPDLWDWCRYAASPIAAISAIQVFLPWALERSLVRTTRLAGYDGFTSPGPTGDGLTWPHLVTVDGQASWQCVTVAGRRAGRSTA